MGVDSIGFSTNSMILSVHLGEQGAMKILVFNILDEVGMNRPSTKLDKVIERYKQGLLRETDHAHYYNESPERYEKIRATMKRVRKAVYAYETEDKNI